MATSAKQSNKLVKRMTSRKSYSWWWDSHTSHKNSKWLAENLEEMDQSVKRMLRLIEEDGDTFAKKAEMYYQKRPELISQVEDFYRMYRSLAERYDHLTGELRKNIPSDLQSQGSGMSDGSEPLSTWPSPFPDRKLSRRKSGPRAPGFDVFLGSGTIDAFQKGDESSTLTDSESESDDDSSVNNYSAISANSGDHHGLNLKIIELEIDIREAREKLQLQQEENGEGPVKGSGTETPENIRAKISRYEQELKHLNERLRLLDEVNKLKAELERFRSLDSLNSQYELNPPFMGEDSMIAKAEDRENNNASKDVVVVSDLQQEDLDSDSKISSVVEELRIVKERLEESQKKLTPLKEEKMAYSERIVHLEGQLASSQKAIAAWKTKYETEKKETTKLHERLARLKTSLSDRDHEIRELKAAVSDAEQKIFPEKSQMKAEMSKLLEERNHLEDQVREWECRGRSFAEDIRNINLERSTMEEALKGEINQLHENIISRDDHIRNLVITLSDLESEKENLDARVATLKGKLGSRDNKIVELEKHLNELHVEHADLISGMEAARKQVEGMKAKAKELEEEIEKHRVVILEGDEAKREAIRQLCSAIEHYRSSYDRLRQALTAQKRGTVSAS